MTANIQISGKANNGIIFVVGGDDYNDFYQNLNAVLGGDEATTLEVITQAARLIVPPSVQGAPTQDQFQQAANVVQGAFGQSQVHQAPPPQQQGYQQQGGYNDSRQPSGPPPGQQAPLCPNHGQPAKWVPPGTSSKTGRFYPGFWACSLNDRACRFPK